MEGISSHSGVFSLFCNFFYGLEKLGLTLILGKHILNME